MISANDLAWMRIQAARMLPDTCTIQAKTLTNQGGGVYDPTWATLAADVPCRMDPARSEDRTLVQGGATDVAELYVLTLPYNAVLSSEHQVVHAGVTYRVVSIASKHSDRMFVRAFVAKV